MQTKTSPDGLLSIQGKISRRENLFCHKRKMCKNCFSKGHTTKKYICKLKCKVNSCGKDQQQVSINSSISHKTTNLLKITTFLQVLTVEVNELLDAGSHTTIITSKVADQI